MLIPSIYKILQELIDLLNQLSQKEYSRSCEALSNATIGEHTRHIIEMFQCLENQLSSGIVNYDNRDRNIRLERDTLFAVDRIIAIMQTLDKKNSNVELLQFIDGAEIRIESNYFRELLYNLEHCIHHQALIKVAILQCATVKIDPNFGVARSTIEYRNQCAQ